MSQTNAGTREKSVRVLPLVFQALLLLAAGVFLFQAISLAVGAVLFRQDPAYHPDQGCDGTGLSTFLSLCLAGMAGGNSLAGGLLGLANRKATTQGGRLAAILLSAACLLAFLGGFAPGVILHFWGSYGGRIWSSPLCR